MNGRQARRHRAAERARLRRILDQARHATPEHVGTLPSGGEVWTVGPIMCVIPPLRDDDPPVIKAAIDRRRRATLTGRCDCGAERRLIRAGQALIEHDDLCLASDANLDIIAACHGLKRVRWP